MDNHTRFVAALHILCGLLGIIVVAAMLLFFNIIVEAFPINAPEWRKVANGIIAVVAAPVLLLSVLEAGAAIAMLYGSKIGRGLTFGFGVLQLINIPIGTAIGAYTLWALLREQPASLPPPAP